MPGNIDQAIAFHASVPARNMKELVALARAKPGSITWGSLGAGSTAHLYLDWMRVKTGADMLQVPYKGSPQAMQAISVGEVNPLPLSPGVFAPQMAAGGTPEDMAVVAKSSRAAGEELVRISKLKFE